MAASPASSPRLPSPPPMAEDQIGPTSPGPASSSGDYGKLAVPQNVDHSAARRIRPGTKAQDMAKGPPLVPITEIDSPFQLTEHLKALHFSYTHPSTRDTSNPIDKISARRLAQSPDSVSRELWLYELCRFHTQALNAIVTALFSASPPCSAVSCPDMRASEWQYLCAVHDPPKSCCAIDYCCHTLDWAAGILTSPRHFPSRLHLGGGEPGGSPDQQLRQLTNIFRRLYRIFAHAWFQHREVFWQVESQSGLYLSFKTVIDMYSLLPQDGYTIPDEADGMQDTQDTQDTPVDAKSSILDFGVPGLSSGPVGGTSTETTEDAMASVKVLVKPAAADVSTIPTDGASDPPISLPPKDAESLVDNPATESEAGAHEEGEAASTSDTATAIKVSQNPDEASSADTEPSASEAVTEMSQDEAAIPRETPESDTTSAAPTDEKEGGLEETGSSGLSEPEPAAGEGEVQTASTAVKQEGNAHEENAEA